MATSNNTVTTAAEHIREVFSAEALRAREFDTVLADGCRKDWTFKGFGDAYVRPRIPNIEVQSKSAGSPLTTTAYTDTAQTITINVHQAVCIEVEEITDILSQTPIKKEMTKKMGYALARAVDVNIASLAASYSQTVGTLGVEPSFDNYLRAIRYLRDAGVPLDAANFFISPACETGIMKMDNFVNAQYRGDVAAKNAAEEFTIGKLGKARVIVSQLLHSGATDQHDSYLVHPDYMALIYAQKNKTTLETIAKELADVVVMSQIYGYGEVDYYSEAAGNVTATDEGAVWIKSI